MPNLSRMPQNAAVGALVGACVGVAFIGVGVLRAGVAVVAGEHFRPLSSSDARLLAFYVIGFAVGGAAYGMVRAVFTKTLGLVMGFMLGGVVVMFAIMVGDEGSFAALDQMDVVFGVIMGIVFGAAAAIGVLRKSQPQ